MIKEKKKLKRQMTPPQGLILKLVPKSVSANYYS